MSVKAILESKSKQVITARPSTSVEAAMELLIANGISCLPVVGEDDRLIGMISDRDIFAKIHQTRGDYHALKVEHLMTTDLIIGLPDDEIAYIAGVMEKNWIRHVPIVEGERVIGVVSQRDIARTRAQTAELENRYLMAMMDKRDKSGDV
ncbi:MAG: CBS domain-containing protein [candidate division Zixibacteria bacterium]|nr:CBS domain-containing protein [candidate division Zixibacteria bacterium]